MLQDFQLQRNGIAEPQRIGSVIVEFVIAQRMNQDVESLPIEHQPGNNLSKLGRVEDDLPLRNWMRTGDAIVVPEFDRKPRSKAFTYFVSDW